MSKAKGKIITTPAKKKAKRKKRPHKGKLPIELQLGDRKPDWVKLRALFMGGKWTTIEDMRKEYALKKQTTYDNTKGWGKARDLADAVAKEEADAITLVDRVQRIAKMTRYQLDVAQRLQIKAFNQLLGKKKNREGKWVDKEFESEGSALQAARLGVAMEQTLLMRRRDDGEGSPPAAPITNNFHGPSQALIIGGGTGLGGTQRALREFTTTDLKSIIDQERSGADSNKAGAAKGTGGARVAGKDGG